MTIVQSYSEDKKKLFGGQVIGFFNYQYQEKTV